MRTVIYKLGGSLFDLPDLPRRLRRVLASRDDERALLVVGGGSAADLVREWDRRFRLGEERSHQLALRAMSLNESLARELLPGSGLVRARAEAEAVWRESGVAILAARDFLASEEAVADAPLPHTWDATSDSIAAWVAIRWPADRLVLLKSAAAPRGRLEPPLVDAHFARLGPQLAEVGWINLRGDDPVEVVVSRHDRA